MADEFAAFSSTAAIPCYHWNIVDIQCQCIAEHQEHHHGDGYGHPKALYIAQDMDKFFPGDCPCPSKVHPATSFCGVSCRSRASMRDTKTSSSDGTICSTNNGLNPCILSSFLVIVTA